MKEESDLHFYFIYHLFLTSLIILYVIPLKHDCTRTHNNFLVHLVLISCFIGVFIFFFYWMQRCALFCSSLLHSWSPIFIYLLLLSGYIGNLNSCTLYPWIGVPNWATARISIFMFFFFFLYTISLFFFFQINKLISPKSVIAVVLTILSSSHGWLYIYEPLLPDIIGCIAHFILI